MTPMASREIRTLRRASLKAGAVGFVVSFCAAEVTAAAAGYLEYDLLGAAIYAALGLCLSLGGGAIGGSLFACMRVMAWRPQAAVRGAVIGLPIAVLIDLGAVLWHYTSSGSVPDGSWIPIIGMLVVVPLLLAVSLPTIAFLQASNKEMREARRPENGAA